MKLSEPAVQEFMALYQDETGHELELEEAAPMALELLRLFALLGLH